MKSNVYSKKLALRKRLIQKRRELARKNLIDFTTYTKKDYIVNWHHELIARKIQNLVESESGAKKLMIYAPPQIGKTELSTRRTSPWILGRDPNTRLIVTAYNSSLAASFNRDVQRIIDDPLYHDLFPETTLNASNVKTIAKGAALRNSDIFEIIGHKGFLKAVGVQGPLTSFTMDFGITDDPIKDRLEANSKTYRDRLWDWRKDVYETRQHNDTKEIITLTRWHHDDLAGRLLARDGLYKDGGKWDMLILEAIKDRDTTPYDPREIGEALWPERHSLERLREVEKTSPKTFVSLYQQRPTKAGGNLIKGKYFQAYTRTDLPKSINVKFTIDPAYTAQEENDPSGILAYTKYQNNFYILDYESVRMEFPDLVEHIPSFVLRNDHSSKGMVWVENKGPGKSAKQSLRRGTALNVSEYKVPGVDKLARVNSVMDFIQGERVFLPKYASWLDAFIEEVEGFPKAPHDESVDCLTMMLLIETKKQKTKASGQFIT